MHTRNINIQDLYLTYTDSTGTPYDQPAVDLVWQGTLIDPETGDDMEIDGAYIDPKEGALTTWESQLADIYVDWFTDYLSIERIAEDYGLDEPTMQGLLGKGRELHRLRCQAAHGPRPGSSIPVRPVLYDIRFENKANGQGVYLSRLPGVRLVYEAVYSETEEVARFDSEADGWVIAPKFGYSGTFSDVFIMES